jgi:DNA-binding transcriptional ArsR family regulator
MQKKNVKFTLNDLFSLQAEFCSIFRNAIRLKILWFLGKEEKSVSEIADYIGVSMSNISQHLRIMKDRRIVKSRKEGQRIYYRITNDKFRQGPALVRKGVIEIYNLDAEAIQEALSAESLKQTVGK